jgi:hypothetical protein
MSRIHFKYRTQSLCGMHSVEQLVHVLLKRSAHAILEGTEQKTLPFINLSQFMPQVFVKDRHPDNVKTKQPSGKEDNGLHLLSISIVKGCHPPQGRALMSLWHPFIRFTRTAIPWNRSTIDNYKRLPLQAPPGDLSCSQMSMATNMPMVKRHGDSLGMDSH